MLEPRVGYYVRDKSLNLYHIIDSDMRNTHSQYPSHFQVECLKGPNRGKIRWVSRNTIKSGSFDIQESI